MVRCQVGAVGDRLELLDQLGQGLTAGRAQVQRRPGLKHHRRRCHRVEFIEEPVDGRGLRGRIGHVVAHDLFGLLHRLAAETGSQLTDQLLTHQLNLLSALGLDPLGLSIGLLGELRRDPLGILARLVGDLLTFVLRVLDGLGVHRVGVGELLARLGTLGERDPDRLLLALHQPLHRRHDPLDDDEHDDGEADQLSDEDRHLTTPT